MKKGTLLFTIEPEPYRVKLEQAKAAEVSAEAAFKQAQAAFERSQELIEKKVTTQALFDQALATREAARASLDQAQCQHAARGDQLRIHAREGAVRRRRLGAQVSVGQYVGGTATPTVLATIVQLDPIYVNFSISEQDVHAHPRRTGASAALRREDLKEIPVEVALQTETDYPHVGHIDYVAPSISPTTGTLGGPRHLRE